MCKLLPKCMMAWVVPPRHKYKVWHNATAAYLVDDCRLVCHAGDVTLPVAGYDRPTSTCAAFHGPTHGSATGTSQLLDHGSGTVCQPDSPVR